MPTISLITCIGRKGQDLTIIRLATNFFKELLTTKNILKKSPTDPMIMIAEKDGDLFDNRFQTDLMIGTPRTIVKDLNDSQDPKHKLYCRKKAFVAIYALFSNKMSPFFSFRGVGGQKGTMSPFLPFFLQQGSP